MHPSFDLKNLREVSKPIQNAATAACHPSCTDAEFSRFVRLWAEGTSQRRDLFLPVFWTVLDPARIPNPTELEDLPVVAKRRISRAMFCLRGLYGAAQPKAAIGSIWPRVFAWVRFAEVYYDAVAPDPLTEMLPKQAILVGLINLTARGNWGRAFPGAPCPPDGTPHLETPGFFAILINGWKLSLERVFDQPDQYVPDVFACAIVLPRYYTQEQYDEIIDAAGGSCDDLALLLIKHITLALRFLRIGPTAASNKFFPLLIQAMDFISIMDGMHERASGNTSGIIHHVPPLVGALCARGGLRLVLRAFAALWDPENAKRADALSKWDVPWIATVATVINVLLPVLLGGPAYIRVALRRGLLAGILSCFGYEMSEELFERVEDIFGRILSAALVHLTVLEVLPRAIEEAEPFAAAVRDHRVTREWNKFKKLAKKHGKVFTAFAARKVSLRACDNVSCTKIGPKANFKQCSGCGARFYCNAQCQLADWWKGMHSGTCAADKVLSTQLRQSFSRRQLSFLRFSLHTFYEKNRAFIHCLPAANAFADDCIASAQTLDPRRGLRVYIADFSFEWGEPAYTPGSRQSSSIAFKSADNAKDMRFLTSSGKSGGRGIPKVILDDWIERAKVSRGRIVLHVMSLRDGPLLIPLRMNMSFREDAARRWVQQSLTERGFAHVMEHFEEQTAPKELLAIHQ